MKIFGIGTDIINIKRINNSIKKGGFNFKKKIFSDTEINYCERKKNSSAFYAKRFAAKEAFAKALGTGITKGISLKDIEIYNDSSGKPNIRLKGVAGTLLKKKIRKSKYYIYLSLSDDIPWAQATVIITYN